MMKVSGTSASLQVRMGWNLSLMLLLHAVTMLLPCQAWLPTNLAPTSTRRATSWTFSPQASSPSSFLSTTTDQDTVVATSSSSPPTSALEANVWAEGTVVSVLSPAVCAIRIEDLQLNNDSTTAVETVKDPTGASSSSADSSNANADLVGHRVLLPDGTRAVVVVHRPPLVFAYRQEEGDTFTDQTLEGRAQVLKEQVSLSSAGSDVASVVDCWGRPCQSSQEQEASNTGRRPIFAPIPQVADIALINHPLLTGTTMLDAVAPLGRGQNMLWIGHGHDDGGRLRGMAMDACATQVQSKTKCVYAAIDNAQDVSQRLKAAGIENDVTLVTPSCSEQLSKESSPDDDDISQSAQAVAMASTACAIAEAHALENGAHSLVVIDSLDWHKDLWDATTRSLVDVFGVDAVVQSDREGGASSEMRAFYSSLIQRAAQYNVRNGGGSVTLLLLTTVPKNGSDSDKEEEEDDDSVFSETDFADCGDKIRERIRVLLDNKVPLTAANLRKVDIPIPSLSEGRLRQALQHVDDLISMTDGQIWLDPDLEAAGQEPPVDPQKSLTRVGIGADTESRADAPALRRVTEGQGGLRMELSQAANMMEGKGASEMTKASKGQIRKRNALLLAMHQTAGTGGRPLSESCIRLMAASQGFLNDAVDDGVLAGSAEGTSLMKDLIQHVRNVAPDAIQEIDTTLDLGPAGKSQLEEAMQSFFDKSSV